MKIMFTKMHGNGNDFILIDEYNSIVISEEDKPKFVRAICNRNFGLGADGVLFVQKSEKAHAKFRYFNSDGSEAEMCGNGIRCFSRYLVEEGYAKSPLRVETLAGIKELEVFKDSEGWWVKVDMGVPKFDKKVWGAEFEFNGRKFKVYAVNTGVPHAVIFDLDFDIQLARFIRYHEVFPKGTNVNFAKIEGNNRIRIRTYERGVEAETLSCGTGSVAVAAVARKLGLVGDNVEIITRGGKLKIDLNDRAFMTGGASRVADGFINSEELRYDLP